MVAPDLSVTSPEIDPLIAWPSSAAEAHTRDK